MKCSQKKIMTQIQKHIKDNVEWPRLLNIRESININHHNIISSNRLKEKNCIVILTNAISIICKSTYIPAKKKTRNKRNCLNLIEGICKKSSANITYNNEMLRHLPKN